MIEVHLGFRRGSFWPAMKRVILIILGAFKCLPKRVDSVANALAATVKTA